MKNLIEELKKAPPNEAISRSLDAQRQIFKRSLFLFAKCALGYRDLTWRTHGQVCAALEAPTKRKLIVMPRGSFKSSLCSVAYPIWLLLTRNTNLRVLLDSELYSNSKNFLREIRSHLESPRLTELYGDMRSSTWNEGEVTLATRTSIKKEASFTCTGLGAEKTGQHYDCVAEGTLVFTSNGYVPIEQIRKGHRVLTSSGRFRSVVATARKQTEKQLIGLRASLSPLLNWVTEDHLVLVFRDEATQWVRARDVRAGDYLARPRVSGRNRQLSRIDARVNEVASHRDVWRFIGYWLAEGARSTQNPNCIRLVFGETEKILIEDVVDIVKRRFGVTPIVVKNGKGALLVRFSNPIAKALLAKFGTRASDKHLPPFALNADLVKQVEMVKGYFWGDGHASELQVSATSVSLSLLEGFRFVLDRLGVEGLRIGRASKGGRKRVVGNWCNTLPSFNLSTTSPKMRQIFFGEPIEFNFREMKPYRGFSTKRFHWSPVLEIKTKKASGFVYDIQVSGVSDFYVPGMVVHNCAILDDMNSPKNSNTTEGCQKVIQHWRYLQAIMDPDSTIVIVATRYSANDLVQSVMDNEIYPEGLL